MLTRLDQGIGRSADIDLVGELAKNMLGRTFCPLGDAAAMPTISFVEKFRDEFEAKLRSASVSLAGVGASPFAVVG
jgi:NADH-quinone oxidoreductase subunit F